jgi:hypothetical protein
MSKRSVPARAKQDRVYTNSECARAIIKHLNIPIGSFCLDPCAGRGSFYHQLPGRADGCCKDWCEIDLGRDFRLWDQLCDYVVTNPPWSAKVYREIAAHAFEIARSTVTFLLRWHNALGTTSKRCLAVDRGFRLREALIVDWRWAGFPSEGFPLAAFVWQRGYTGGCQIIEQQDWYPLPPRHIAQ